MTNQPSTKRALTHIGLALAALGTGALASNSAQASWTENSGSYGNGLSRNYYEGSGAGSSDPIVIFLQGCSTDSTAATDQAYDSGWEAAADANDFYIVAPGTSDTYGCFNWFLAADATRDDGGELDTIWEMVGDTQSDLSLSGNDIYVVGFSGGAGMAAAMLGAFPEAIEAGAIESGIPYGCATIGLNAIPCMATGFNGLLTPSQMGVLLDDACGGNSACDGYSDSSKPDVMILHGIPGTNGILNPFTGVTDTTVTYPRAYELRDQFTSWENVSTSSPGVSTSGNAKTSNYPSTASSRIRLVEITQLGHNMSLATSSCGTEVAGSFTSDNPNYCAVDGITSFFQL